MAREKFTFQAEVGKLLDIVAHSLYSHKEIFLRELISNSSDACDKLRYEALTNSDLIDGDSNFSVSLSVDAKKKTLSISDNGIGMNHDDLLETLGTIASSGTQSFIDQLGKDGSKDVDLIGQFGVGFYSAFMVSKKVEVLTRKAGDEKAWLWISDGKGEFTIDEATRDSRGTTVTLYLAKGEDEYLEPTRIRNIVKSHSDHIGIPVILNSNEEGNEPETLNEASALWTRPKKDITEEQYKEFYHHVGGGFDEPWMTIHNSVEGVLSYTNLLFIPSTQPFDMFQPERKTQVKLYVNRVFITDDCDGLLPAYLRFLRGIVDSEDLPLNISREMFQHDPRLAKIKAGLTKRVLGELKKKAKKPEDYTSFWSTFGSVMKEGLYEDFENRDALLELARFHSTNGDEVISLADYVERMKDGQDTIYYINGEDLAQARRSPQLEGFRAKGIEVLLLTDPIDEFWMPSVGAYKEKEFKSATRGGADLDKFKSDDKDANKKDEDKADTPALEALFASFKDALGEQVKDVRASDRLTDSAVCLVADEGDLDIRTEQLMKRHAQMQGGGPTPRILEVNPTHPLIKRLGKLATSDAPDNSLSDAAFLLFDQARIMEGESVADATEFARRM
ncbi:MAG: molecular chaperone HtpG, partial [Rhodospirillales bacterium]